MYKSEGNIIFLCSCAEMGREWIILIKKERFVNNFNEEKKICNSRGATGARSISFTVFRFQGTYIKKKETP